MEDQVQSKNESVNSAEESIQEKAAPSTVNSLSNNLNICSETPEEYKVEISRLKLKTLDQRRKLKAQKKEIENLRLELEASNLLVQETRRSCEEKVKTLEMTVEMQKQQWGDDIKIYEAKLDTIKKQKWWSKAYPNRPKKKTFSRKKLFNQYFPSSISKN